MSWRTCPDCGVQWDPAMGPNVSHECPVARERTAERASNRRLLIEIRDLLRELVQRQP